MKIADPGKFSVFLSPASRPSPVLRRAAGSAGLHGDAEECVGEKNETIVENVRIVIGTGEIH